MQGTPQVTDTAQVMEPPQTSFSSTSGISRPQFKSDNDYEVLSENGGYQILRWADLSTLASASSFSGPLPEPLQPVVVTGETVTTTSFGANVDTLSKTNTTTMSLQLLTLGHHPQTWKQVDDLLVCGTAIACVLLHAQYKFIYR